jgi:beta-1,4-mannosyltransferase
VTAPVRVVALVGPSVRDHPYIELSHAALEKKGVSIDLRSELNGLARSIPADVDAVHLHWPELMGYRSDRPLVGAAATHLLGLRLLSEFSALRRSRTRFIWTAHDLLPHELRYRRLEEAIYRSAARADGVLAHSRFAANRLREFEPKVGRTAVAAHGNFIGYYAGDGRDRDQIRAELGLPADAYVYLLFGNIRPYKQTAAAVRAFSSTADPLARLLVAGKAADEDATQAVRQAAAADDRVRLEIGHVANDRVSGFHAAADAVILNHRAVFSSGALLLALSQGLPVVAPAGGTTEEMTQPPALVAFEPGHLPAALDEVRRGDQGQRRRAALDAAERCTWEFMAQQLLALYLDRPAAEGP